MPQTTRTKNERILRTKFYRPLVPRDFVCRSRLHDAINQGIESPIVLVSAPAGYGKSTLVSHWVEAQAEPWAWLSLDDSDSDVAVFLEYLLAAIETIHPDVFPRTRLLTRAADFPPIRVVANALNNELDALGMPFFLVLDDYHHLASSSATHELVGRVLAHPPRFMRLILISRRDPPLGLTSLRAQGRLNEVRLADLRFTPSETRSLLESSLGLRTSDAAVANLQREMEGWAVGLRLATIALRRAVDPESALRKLRGGIQGTREYLLQEVIDGQTSEVRDWLLKTSILDRFCPALCEALCMAEDASAGRSLEGEAFVRTLQENNLFTIALDTTGDWFRYHHLFRELLRTELARRASPNEIGLLHARASRWHEAQDLFAEAIRHAITAGSPVTAAEILERHRRSELDLDHWPNLERWLALLPPELVEQRPRLLLARAWVLHYRHRHGDIARVVTRLEEIIVGATLDSLTMAELKLFQGSQHFWSGRLEQARQTLLEAQEPGVSSFASTAGLRQVYLALAEQMLGERRRIRRALDRRIQDAGQLPAKYQLNLIGARSYVHLLSGDLYPAADDGRWMQQIATDNDLAYLESWGHYLTGNSLLRAGQFQAAKPYLLASVEHRYVMYRRSASDAMVGLALTRQALHQDDAAEATGNDLLAFAGETGDLDLMSLAQSGRARLALARGDLDAAARWARSVDLSAVSPTLLFWLDNPVITQARILVAAGSEGEVRQASELLARLEKGAAVLHNDCQRIEILVLQSVALSRFGHTDDALAILEHIIGVAERGGWKQPFIEAGSPMADLLQRLVERKGCESYADRLLAAMTGIGGRPSETDRSLSAADTAMLAESLTGRELDVLECLTRRLRNKEIAQQLSISEETVKSHLKNLYQKLGVGSRRQAAVRAEELRPFLESRRSQ